MKNVTTDYYKAEMNRGLFSLNKLSNRFPKPLVRIFCMWRNYIPCTEAHDSFRSELYNLKEIERAFGLKDSPDYPENPCAIKAFELFREKHKSKGNSLEYVKYLESLRVGYKHLPFKIDVNCLNEEIKKMRNKLKAE